MILRTIYDLKGIENDCRREIKHCYKKYNSISDNTRLKQFYKKKIERNRIALIKNKELIEFLKLHKEIKSLNY